jgi:hypothetical protein
MTIPDRRHLCCNALRRATPTHDTACLSAGATPLLQSKDAGKGALTM